MSVIGLGLVASSAHAQPRRPASPATVSKACGETAIPLVVGNEWVYGQVGVPGYAPSPQEAAKAAKQFPQPAKKITIDVVGVETANNVTTVQLEEDVDGHKLKTSITCTADRFTVDPQSFWFAGDPGGVYNLELQNVVHKDGTTLHLVGGKLEGPEWRDDITANWQQTQTPGTTPQLWKGKLEIERDFKTATNDDITVSLDGQQHVYRAAQKLLLTISGRITLDPADKDPMEFPDMSNSYWIVDGTGIVQIQNSYGAAADQTHASWGHMYQLISVKLH